MIRKEMVLKDRSRILTILVNFKSPIPHILQKKKKKTLYTRKEKN